MAKETITRRQKDISRLLRERKESYPNRLKALEGRKVWKKKR